MYSVMILGLELRKNFIGNLLEVFFLKNLDQSFLSVVFCHPIEHVSDELLFFLWLHGFEVYFWLAVYPF
jgi:hypothetical protein